MPALRARLEALACTGAELRPRLNLLRSKSTLLGHYACDQQLTVCLAAVAAENSGQRYPLQRAVRTGDLSVCGVRCTS